MANLPVPTPASEVPGNFITGALWNANVFNGLTYLLNPPLFYGYAGTGQSVTGSVSVGVPLNMDTEVLDTYNGHSTTTNNSRYIGQVPGYYKVWGSYSGGGVTSQTEIACWVAKNGTEQPGSRQTIPSSSAHSFIVVSNAVYVFLNGTTDYVEVYGLTDVTGTTHTSPASSLLVEFKHT